MIRAGTSYSDMGKKYKRNYKLQRVQDQPPTLPRADRKFKKLGSPYKWRKCEFCNEGYQARLNSKRRTCGDYGCRDAMIREWLWIHRTRMWQINDKHREKVKQNPNLVEKRRAYQRENYQKNKERISIRKKAYYQQHKEELKAKSKPTANSGDRSAYYREYYQKNGEKLRAYKKQYYATHRDEIRERRKTWRIGRKGSTA